MWGVAAFKHAEFVRSLSLGARADVLDDFQTAGPAELARRRAIGADPTQTPEANRARGKANAQRQREAQEWEQANGGRPDPAVFTREVLPGLREVSLSQMMRASGLSLRYCSVIRQGKYMPHPRHWEVLRRLAAQCGRSAVTTDGDG
jgi:hypothetical protein